MRYVIFGICMTGLIVGLFCGKRQSRGSSGSVGKWDKVYNPKDRHC